MVHLMGTHASQAKPYSSPVTLGWIWANTLRAKYSAQYKKGLSLDTFVHKALTVWPQPYKLNENQPNSLMSKYRKNKK